MLVNSSKNKSIIAGMILFWVTAGLALAASPANLSPAAPLCDWLICGEFPYLPPGEITNVNTNGLVRDYLTEHGGETGIVPQAGMTHSRPDGTQAVWTQYHFATPKVDLRALFERQQRPVEQVVAYAYTTIDAKTAGKVLLSLGSDDGIKVWGNGNFVFEKHARRACIHDDDQVEIPLQAGKNCLLLKIDQGSGPWAFTVRTTPYVESLTYANERELRVRVATTSDHAGTTVSVKYGRTVIAQGIIAATSAGTFAQADVAVPFPPGDEGYDSLAVWLGDQRIATHDLRETSDYRKFHLAILRSQVAPRQYYHARYEPVATVLHGAGQSRLAAFTNYIRAIGNEATCPAIFMDYHAADTSPERIAAHYQKLGAALRSGAAGYPDHVVTLQIGFSMTQDGKPERHYEDKVARGDYDENIKAFCEALNTYVKRPVYIRIGFEFNGSQNGYQPATYKQAFIHVTKMLRQYHVAAATVWCANPIRADMEFYPGDQWVDWWGLDIFGADEITGMDTYRFLNAARARKKPVLIGESTAQTIGTIAGLKSWDTWFAPYFGLIHSQPGIKAFFYINWNWNGSHWNWGDARLEANEIVAKKYAQEMLNPLYRHATTNETFP